MLKVTYTEMGLYIEDVSISMQQLITQRAMLAVTLGKSLYIESGKASFELNTNELTLCQLKFALRGVDREYVSVKEINKDIVEITVAGVWMAENVKAEQGIFIINLSDEVELLIYKLWQCSFSKISLPL